jgi:hypothetical protein
MDSQNEVNNPVKTFFRLHKIAFSYIFSRIKQHIISEKINSTPPSDNSFRYAAKEFMEEENK